jgi:hypothetical protein
LALNFDMPQDELILNSFGSENPRLVQFRNCILIASDRTIPQLVRIVGEPVGIWGERLLVDSRGEAYLEPQDGAIVEDFMLWELPLNQREAVARGAFGKLGVFTMVIRSRTSPELLRAMSDTTRTRADYLDYFEWIERVADWIPSLGWVLIPLAGESNHALFACSPCLENLADGLEASEHAFGQAVVRLVKNDRTVSCVEIPPSRAHSGRVIP